MVKYTKTWLKRRIFSCAESITNLSRLELKKTVFDLGVAFHMCRIEFASAGKHSDGHNKV